MANVLTGGERPPQGNPLPLGEALVRGTIDEIGESLGQFFKTHTYLQAPYSKSDADEEGKRADAVVVENPNGTLTELPRLPSTPKGLVEMVLGTFEPKDLDLRRHTIVDRLAGLAAMGRLLTYEGAEEDVLRELLDAKIAHHVGTRGSWRPICWRTRSGCLHESHGN